MLRRKFLLDCSLILGFSALGFGVMGYHPGIEDDGIYLTAIKSNLNPSLFPHDSEFFRLQLQATLFDKWMAGLIRFTGLSVSVMELLCQFGAIVLTLFACWSIVRQLFPEKRAQWAGVAMVAAMFTLPVAGTALFLVDQHLHARNVATALVLLAVSWVLAGKRFRVIPLLILAMLIHPIMATLGVSFCICLSLSFSEPAMLWLTRRKTALAEAVPLAAAVPLGWILEPPNPLWKKALDTRTYYYLYKWTWYEWLGALAPLLLFWLLWRLARRRNETVLARFALSVFVYGMLQQGLAMFVLSFPSLVRLTPLQPMRYLQIVYFFMALIGGAYIGKYLLKSSVWRWAAFLLIFNGSMLAAQCAEFDGSQHIEWPGRAPENSWLQAFAWIRVNTPTSAYFALDPRYLEAPGEDYHSFRALAERSQLADAIKDTAVVTQVPELGEDWNRQVEAQDGWRQFRLGDFERLKAEFGVDWVLVDYPNQPAGLECQWHNDLLTVCEIP